MPALLIPALLLALLAGILQVGWAQGPGSLPQRRLEISGLDVTSFPEIGVNLIVTDRQSRPLRELRALRLRESSAPVADYETLQQTVGTDLIVVIDANSRIEEADDAGGLTRLQTVKDSIMMYAGRFMDLAGRDRVTVVVPDGAGEGGRLLAEDVALPAELIDAVRPYDVGRLSQSAVMELLALALDEAAAGKGEGRFQAIVLYSDTTGLNEARYDPLIERAQALQTPIFLLVLGGGETPSENAVQAATALTMPTRGTFAAMPAASDSSEVYQIIADNGVQTQLRYRSNIRRSGAYSITVSLENLRADASLQLSLAPPEVQLDVPGVIQRAGTQADDPLEQLQPEVQPLAAQVTWPDGLPRRLQGAALLANGRAQEAPFFGGGGVLQFDWRIAELEPGPYELMVVVTDTLGMRAESAAQTTTITVSRPEALPTAQPTPTAAPLEAIRELLPPLPARAQVEPYLAPVGAVLVVLLALLVMAQRRREARERAALAAQTIDPDDDVVEEAAAGAGERAYLELLPAEPGAEGRKLALEGVNVTIGSAEEKVQLALADKSVSAYHARIRRRGGHYWLYDEGSEQGTFLNHERLGLAPREVQEGDVVQFGGVRGVFRVGEEGGD